MADHLNFQAYVSKTSSDKDIKHALEPYILSYQNGASTFEMLRECIMNWIRTHQVSSSRRKGFTVPSSSSSSTTLATDTASRISKFEDVEIPNALTHFILCTFCKNFLSDPITAFCGHTYCRKCMKKRGILLNCRKCDTPFSSLELNSYKTNVVIASLLKKWWPQQVLSVQLKDEADDLFQKNDLDGALRKYAAAVESGGYVLMHDFEIY